MITKKRRKASKTGVNHSLQNSCRVKLCEYRTRQEKNIVIQLYGISNKIAMSILFALLEK